MARFPLTAAALEHEAEALAAGLLGTESFRSAIERHVMASVSDLKQALDSAKASVDSLVARVGENSGSGIDPKDLDPILDEISTLRSTVEAVTSSLEKPAANGTATNVSGTGEVAPAPAV